MYAIFCGCTMRYISNLKLLIIKWKTNKTCHNNETFPKSNRKIIAKYENQWSHWKPPFPSIHENPISPTIDDSTESHDNITEENK